jgi:hypothetical protein
VGVDSLERKNSRDLYVCRHVNVFKYSKLIPVKLLIRFKKTKPATERRKTQRERGKHGFVFSDKWSSYCQLGQRRLQRVTIFNFVVKNDDRNNVDFLKSFYSTGILCVKSANVVSYPVKEYKYSIAKEIF